MSAATELRTRLVNLGTLPTITIGHMPDLGDTPIGTIYDYSGAPISRGFGVIGVQYEHPALQIVFRGAPEDYEGPKANAYIAFYDLAKIQAEVVGSVEYLQVDPQQTPFRIRAKDENNRFYLGFNVYIHKVPS